MLVLTEAHEDTSQFRLVNVCEKEEQPFEELFAVAARIPSRQVHAIAGRIKRGRCFLLVLPLASTAQVLDAGESVIEFVQDVRACFPSLVRRNPMTYASDSEDEDSEEEKENEAAGSDAKDQTGTRRYEVMPSCQSAVKIVSNVATLLEAFPIERGSAEQLQRVYRADAQASHVQFLCVEVRAPDVAMAPVTCACPLSALNMGVFYSEPADASASFLPIPLIEAPIGNCNDVEVYQDVHVFSFNTRREATEHGGGKSSEEMVHNIRMRHASGTFCTLVYPSMQWPQVQSKYAKYWPEVGEIQGEMRSRRILGPLSNRPVELHLM